VPTLGRVALVVRADVAVVTAEVVGATALATSADVVGRACVAVVAWHDVVRVRALGFRVALVIRAGVLVVADLDRSANADSTTAFVAGGTHASVVARRDVWCVLAGAVFHDALVVRAGVAVVAVHPLAGVAGRRDRWHVVCLLTGCDHRNHHHHEKTCPHRALLAMSPFYRRRCPTYQSSVASLRVLEKKVDRAL